MIGRHPSIIVFTCVYDVACDYHVYVWENRWLFSLAFMMLVRRLRLRELLRREKFNLLQTFWLRIDGRTFKNRAPNLLHTFWFRIDGRTVHVCRNVLWPPSNTSGMGQWRCIVPPTRSLSRLQIHGIVKQIKPEKNHFYLDEIRKIGFLRRKKRFSDFPMLPENGFWRLLQTISSNVLLR